jgi:hypothetical protein
MIDSQHPSYTHLTQKGGRAETGKEGKLPWVKITGGTSLKRQHIKDMKGEKKPEWKSWSEALWIETIAKEKARILRHLGGFEEQKVRPVHMGKRTRKSDR